MAIAAKKYNETQLYRDSSIFLQRLVKVTENLPRMIQNSIGNIALRDGIRLPQLCKLAYETSKEVKLGYINEAILIMSCLEVIVNQLYECRYINESKKADLYLILGYMLKQTKAWRDKIITTN